MEIYIKFAKDYIQQAILILILMINLLPLKKTVFEW